MTGARVLYLTCAHRTNFQNKIYDDKIMTECTQDISASLLSVIIHNGLRVTVTRCVIFYYVIRLPE